MKTTHYEVEIRLVEVESIKDQHGLNAEPPTKNDVVRVTTRYQTQRGAQEVYDKIVEYNGLLQLRQTLTTRQ